MQQTPVITKDLDELMDKLWNGIVEPGDNHSPRGHDHIRAVLAEAYARGFDRGKESANTEALWDIGPIIGGGD